MSSRPQNDSNYYDTFLNICPDTLDDKDSIKRKYLWLNYTPFMNKDISKAIINRTRLRNRFLKSKFFKNKAAYNKRRNSCVSLLRKTKTDCYNNFDHKIAYNRFFWKHIKPHFTDKSLGFKKITLVEKQ